MPRRREMDMTDDGGDATNFLLVPHLPISGQVFLTPLEHLDLVNRNVTGKWAFSTANYTEDVRMMCQFHGRFGLEVPPDFHSTATHMPTIPSLNVNGWLGGLSVRPDGYPRFLRWLTMPSLGFFVLPCRVSIEDIQHSCSTACPTA